MPSYSVVTATIGRPKVKLVASGVKNAMFGLKYEHIFMWDDKRADNAIHPEELDGECVVQHMAFHAEYSGVFKQGILLAMARNDYVINIDDDCWIEDPQIFYKIDREINYTGRHWGYWLRSIYDQQGNYIGVDRYASIGTLPHCERGLFEERFVDMNCMCIKRELAAEMTPYMTTTEDYHSDRYIYNKLCKIGGPPFIIELPLIAYTIPDEHVNVAKYYCEVE
jgi:hypothetical protein